VSESSYGFPISHVFVSVVFYGFNRLCAVALITLCLAAHHDRYRFGCTLVFFVALSQLYLGTHYLTGILASFLAAMSVLSRSLLLSKRHINGSRRFRQRRSLAPAFGLAVVLAVYWLLIAALSSSLNAIPAGTASAAQACQHDPIGNHLTQGSD